MTAPQPLPPLPRPHPAPQPHPHPAGPMGPRAALDALTGPLPAGATACARWGQALVDGDQDRLAESRAVAIRVANLLTAAGGGRHG